MSNTITVEIKKCSDCTHCRKERDYTEDSFETCFRFDCMNSIHFPKNGKLDVPKNIARYVDWYESDPCIPNWCPLISKEKI